MNQDDVLLSAEQQSLTTGCLKCKINTYLLLHFPQFMSYSVIYISFSKHVSVAFNHVVYSIFKC